MPSLVNCFVKYGGASGCNTGLQQDEKWYLVLRSSSIAVQLNYRICCRGAIRYVFCPSGHRCLALCELAWSAHQRLHCNALSCPLPEVSREADWCP